MRWAEGDVDSEAFVLGNAPACNGKARTRSIAGSTGEQKVNPGKIRRSGCDAKQSRQQTKPSFSQTPAYRIGALRSAELLFGLWSSLPWRGPQLGAERTAQYEMTLYFNNSVFTP